MDDEGEENVEKKGTNDQEGEEDVEGKVLRMGKLRRMWSRSALRMKRGRR